MNGECIVGCLINSMECTAQNILACLDMPDQQRFARRISSVQVVKLSNIVFYDDGVGFFNLKTRNLEIQQKLMEK